jgi:SAM-dependent methyltransferase
MNETAEILATTRLGWARRLSGAAAGSPKWLRTVLRLAARSKLLRAIARPMLMPGAVANAYAAEVSVFNRRMRSPGVSDIERYRWYHSVDLPVGGIPGTITTPGMYDYRDCIAAFRFPEDMRGMNVLDVGSATGFFAFEFERRGARVVSVELPSLADLDRFPGEELRGTLDRIQRMNAPENSAGSASEVSAQDLYHYLLEAPFQLCSRLLGSRVERPCCTIYELSPERLGRPSFDYVFAGDVLMHTLRPFDALAALARICSGTMVIAQFLPGNAQHPPAMFYEGGEYLDQNPICWWLPNEQCLKQLLRKPGFAEVRAVGNYEGLHRPAGNLYSRRILHATKANLCAQRSPAA